MLFNIIPRTNKLVLLFFLYFFYQLTAIGVRNF